MRKALLVCFCLPTVLFAESGSVCPSKYVTALARDKEGCVWVGTEDDGVYRLSPSLDACKQFKAKDGVADENVYGMAVDRSGRVWCGTLNHGVSVYNGKGWQNYGIADGLLGERVFDVACSPHDGDVWIATSAGLVRWSSSSGTWSPLTRANGLPSDQVASLAFNSRGDLIAGLQCGGVSSARAVLGFASWEHAEAPWYFDKRQCIPYTLTPEGEGLPSNLINAVLMTKDGTLWAATASGVAWSLDSGKKWRFLRGKNYAAKMKGVLGGAPSNWRPPDKKTEDRLLPDDYVTSLAEGADGAIWMGFREKGCAVFHPKTLKLLQWIKPGGKRDSPPFKDGFVTCMLPLPDGRILAGCYGEGIVIVTPSYTPLRKATALSPSSSIGQQKSFSDFPLPACPSSDASLSRLIEYLHNLRKKSIPAGTVFYLGEDWTTQGDGIGRYGRQGAMFCAMNAPLCDYYQTGCDPRYGICGMIGPNYPKDFDALRHWIHWIKTDNSRSLYAPTIGIRRQAEWDDHGEAYPSSLDGPDVWVVARVPEGPHRINLYFYNKDGHTGRNRMRDYLLEVREYRSSLGEKTVFQRTPVDKRVSLNVLNRDLTNAIPLKVLARARVQDFWGGVHKSFVVQGPGLFHIRIARNGSHNTIVSGVMLDKIPEPLEPLDNPRISTRLNYAWVVYDAPCVGEASNQPNLLAAMKLWDEAWGLEGYAGGVNLCRIARVCAYRSALANHAPAPLLDNWRWHLHLWDTKDRQSFTDTMAKIWEAKQNLWSFYQSAECRPYSPNVIPYTSEECAEMARKGIDWHQFIPKDKPYKVELLKAKPPIMKANGEKSKK